MEEMDYNAVLGLEGAEAPAEGPEAAADPGAPAASGTAGTPEPAGRGQGASAPAGGGPPEPQAGKTGGEQAKARAEALMNELSMGFLTGTMEIAGLPAVIPGRMVTVAKVNDDFNRDYFITKVVHHMDKDGFQTTIDFAGNKM